jgi:hypothetical protein
VVYGTSPRARADFRFFACDVLCAPCKRLETLGSIYVYVLSPYKFRYISVLSLPRSSRFDHGTCFLHHKGYSRIREMRGGGGRHHSRPSSFPSPSFLPISSFDNFSQGLENKQTFQTMNVVGLISEREEINLNYIPPPRTISNWNWNCMCAIC